MEVAQPGNPASESALLRCLSQLNNDVLEAYLLPRLVEQGSSAAVALSCSQLRRLCQLSIQHLDLSKQLQDGDNPCQDVKLARQLVAAFPNCTLLDFAWASSSLVRVSRSITPLLTGLPNLSTISIKLSGSSDLYDLDPVLCQIHVHATGLHCLSLQLCTSWANETDKSCASLGRMTNLTRLQLTFDRQVAYPFSQGNLRPLTGLTKLQSLIIEAPRARLRYLKADSAGLQLATQQFPGRLTSLTELWLPLNAVNDISSVSECVRLCDLRILAEMALTRKWGAHEWAALAHLTSLTCLHVGLTFGEGHKGESEAFYGVLRQLKGLPSVGAAIWDESTFLPVLQSLTDVTSVCGLWYQGGASELNPPSCPHIKELGRTMKAPFQAFPHLLGVQFVDVYIEDLVALGRCCTGLHRLTLAEGCLAEHHNDQGLSAFKSLAQLQHLTHLELIPPGDVELVAFTSAAASVSNPQLRCLHVQGLLTIHALMQLHCVRGLKELHVHASDVTFAVEAVRTSEICTRLLQSTRGIFPAVTDSAHSITRAETADC